MAKPIKSHYVSFTSEANRWTASENFILTMFLGQASYAEIALRLGRKPGAVQRQASRTGASQRAEWSQERESKRAKSKAHSESLLKQTEEDLAAYLPECFEDPVLPHAGDRTYHREYKRKQRSAG